jgi:uncharacterized protein YecT (DUF1311 family)
MQLLDVMRRTALALMALLMAVPIVSALETAEGILDRCVEEWGFPNAIAECVDAVEARYGKQLAETYNRLRKTSGVNDILLRDAQRAWLSYQKQNCELHVAMNLFESPSIPFPPGVSRLAGSFCSLRTTLQRLEELNALAPKARPK